MAVHFFSHDPGRETAGRIEEATSGAPDPIRARRNLQRLLGAANAGDVSTVYLRNAALLLSASQFLANFCIENPDELDSAFGALGEPVDREASLRQAQEEFALFEDMEEKEFMKRLRLFKKRRLLRVTLRDLGGRTDIAGTMEELTALAEAVIEVALRFAVRANENRFGTLQDDGGISLIGLGKLGGEEINYSSDVDLVAVYPDVGGQVRDTTLGILSPAGVRMGRISAHEYYCKVVETLGRVLSSSTEEGIAYRLDLRLRPQGQRGEIAMPLSSYRTYYELWGRTWERMTLIRARPIAGNTGLGREFMEMLEPFVWKRGVEYSDVEEIRALKKKIDSTILRDDIKRGYGGIREVEFFVHTFQLIYGAENRALRTCRLLNAMQGLRRMRLIPEEEFASMWSGYLHLRRIEHFLQMKDDLQTYRLPSSEGELDVLGRLMGFPGRREFLSDLRLRRMKIKNMYNSLLGTPADIEAEALALIEGDLSEEELEGYLAFKGVRDTRAGVRSLNKIREMAGGPRSRGERAFIRRVVPGLLDMALEAESPDRAMAGLESFFSTHGIKEAYLTALTEEKALANGVIKVFSLSTFLTRLFLSSPRYLNILVEEMPIRKSLCRMKAELARSLKSSRELERRLAEFKAVEWIRLGMYFLSGVISAYNLQRFLSHLADAVVTAALVNAGGGKGFSVVALGKHGGRELAFGSDLDLLFVGEGSTALRTAEGVLKVITAYTERGKLYDVDMRLRPDGSKGPLLKDMEGYGKYYMQKAQGWEVQALLKARPVAGDRSTGLAFMEMAHNVIVQRGPGVSREEIAAMRERITAGLFPEGHGVDVKRGSGGMEDVEFFVQWLQLQHAPLDQRVLVQDTLSAIRCLTRRGVLSPRAGNALRGAYEYLARLKAFLRLNEEHGLVPGSGTAGIAALFMGHEGEEDLFAHLEDLRQGILDVIHT